MSNRKLPVIAKYECIFETLAFLSEMGPDARHWIGNSITSIPIGYLFRETLDLSLFQFYCSVWLIVQGGDLIKASLLTKLRIPLVQRLTLLCSLWSGTVWCLAIGCLKFPEESPQAFGGPNWEVSRFIHQHVNYILRWLNQNLELHSGLGCFNQE